VVGNRNLRKIARYFASSNQTGISLLKLGEDVKKTPTPTPTPTPKQAIKHLMTKYGSHDKIAIAANVSRSTVQKIATDEIQNPSYNTMQKLLKKTF